MIICPFCQTPHVDNTLFCDECGTYLLDEETRDTFPLLDDDTSATGITLSQNADAPSADKAILRPHTPPVVQFKIDTPPKIWEISMEKTIYLGRLDPAANIYPEIDFTEVNGLEQGISRQHARLFYKEGVLYIEDLGSINGTFLNEHRLMAYLPEPLVDDVLLVLGRLKITISLRT